MNPEWPAREDGEGERRAQDLPAAFASRTVDEQGDSHGRFRRRQTYPVRGCWGKTYLRRGSDTAFQSSISVCPSRLPMIQCDNIVRGTDMVKTLTKHGNSLALLID